MAIDEIRIGRKDVIWNYLASIINLGSGFFILPLILNKLSAEEIGMNYLMQSIVFFVALVSAEFSRQFGRNITYVLSGKQEFEKEGVKYVSDNTELNYHLLNNILKTTTYVYRLFALIVLFLLLSLGTLYMYNATDGFNNVANSLLIWFLFSLSTSLNIYITYYSSFLSGSAMIMQFNKATIISRLSYIIIASGLIILGYGLIGVVLGLLVSPFISAIYSHNVFYTKELKSKLKNDFVALGEVRNTFKILWYNTKKNLGDCLGIYLVNQGGMFACGLYLPLNVVASYGLMFQLFQLLASFSRGMFASYLPMFYKYRVKNQLKDLKDVFSFTMVIYYICFIIGFVVIIFFAPSALVLIRANAILPSFLIVLLYGINVFFEINKELCSNLIVAKNEVPFVKSSILSGFLIVALNIITLKYTNTGLPGVVLGQLFIQGLYNYWRWPKYVLTDFNWSFCDYIFNGCFQIKDRLLNIIHK